MSDDGKTRSLERGAHTIRERAGDRMGGGVTTFLELPATDEA
jgi:hypothetical protein